MLNINTRVLTLTELLDHINVGTIMQMIDELNEAKVMLEDSKTHFTKDISVMSRHLGDILGIDQQLGFLRINLAVLKEALFLIEAKAFNGKLCLN